MSDPIKHIIKTKKFNIYIWEGEGIPVSYLNKFTYFKDMDDLLETKFLIEELLEYLKGE